ncbi:MAG: CapA family protein [Acidimicrobiales bacterium]
MVIGRGRRTRARRLSLLVGSVGLAVLGGTATLAAASDPDPSLTGAPVLANDTMALTIVGDTMLGDAAQHYLDRYGYEWPAAKLPPWPAGSVVVANLEGPITTSTTVLDPDRPWTYNADPAAAPALRAIGVDVVSLANNHSMDRGLTGLTDSIAHTTAAGIVDIGAGENLARAQRPFLLDTPSGRLALFGFEDTNSAFTARHDRPGTLRLSNEAMADAAARADDAGAVVTVAYVHWGENYAPVDDRQRERARALVEAGFDLVVGAGSHTGQPIEIVDGVPVAYSVGNFLFGTPGRYPAAAPGRSHILTVTFEPGRGMTLDVRCLEVDNEDVAFQPRACGPADAPAYYRSISPDLVYEPTSGAATMDLPAPSS